MVYQIMAISVMAAFYGIYFVKLFNQRKKGIQTNLLGKGKQGFAKFVEVALKDVTYLVPLVEVISIFTNTYLDFIWLRAAGITLGVLGVIIFAVSVFTMRDNWRAGVPKDENTELVTLLAVVFLHLQIVKVEEDFLITTFGDDYLTYKKKVCRYIGRKR